MLKMSKIQKKKSGQKMSGKGNVHSLDYVNTGILAITTGKGVVLLVVSFLIMTNYFLMVYILLCLLKLNVDLHLKLQWYFVDM